MSKRIEELKDWKPENYLKNEEAIKLYLKAAQEEECDDPRFIGEVLRAVAAARELNAAELARRSKMTREGVVKALAKEGNPTIKTLTKIAKTLGVTIKIEIGRHQQAAE